MCVHVHPTITINFTSLNEGFFASGMSLSQREWGALLTLSLSLAPCCICLFCWADLEFRSSKIICQRAGSGLPSSVNIKAFSISCEMSLLLLIISWWWGRAGVTLGLCLVESCQACHEFYDVAIDVIFSKLAANDVY